MKIEKVKAARPDVKIVLSADEADWLLSAMFEAKSFASDCEEDTEIHELWIRELTEATDT